ncbi:choice-of-anchor Q domain-containing protein [Dokdonella sp.]|uniref:choice-of-anchor Q domain-containing protein n=1 Tax=Dokdonella sp. TaxID=2291710 RepID=UPI001B267733|nr:choice-of-anchor Q domain-containing protein [Dokdonella sp.]MBO9663622.1 hypothetical protein [Dokdonella sp.]
MHRHRKRTFAPPSLHLLAGSLAVALALGAASGAAAATALSRDELLDRAGRASDGENPLAEQWKLRHPPTPPRPQGSVTHLVTNCDDSGAGSLRDAIGDAASGDTIDLRGLTCSTITLTTGALATGVDDLLLVGPGMNSLSISGNNSSPVLVHLGTGRLGIEGLTVIDGAKYTSGSANAFGGCVYSQGGVRMVDAGAKYCLAQADGTGAARGGGVYARLGAEMLDSVISGNEVRAASAFSAGGGLHTYGGVVAKYSIFRNNAAYSSGGSSGMGGAASIAGNVAIGFVTVHGNSAEQIGGLVLFGVGAGTNLEIANSTITDNTATDSAVGSGVFIGRDAIISNSTITGNVEANSSHTSYGAGLFVAYDVDVDLRSTIVSGNHRLDDTTSVPSDIGTPTGSLSVVGGSHNLIGAAANFGPMPGDTLFDVDPRLGPLANNGGRTPTMLPLPHSIAINAGSGSGDYDQRGLGYPRRVGAGVDIGAIESDVLFADGFD